MKKSLLAVAAIGAFASAAQAQSSVTVYGILDVGYVGANTRVSSSATTTNSGQTKTTSNTFGLKGAENTSRLGFKGGEDLGGGTSAFFTIEAELYPQDQDVSGNTNGGLLNRQTFVGLKKNGIGQAALGLQYTPVFNAGSATSPGQYNNIIGDVIYQGGLDTVLKDSGNQTFNASFTNRTANTLSFKSDTFYGFSASAIYTLNNTNASQTSSTAGGNTNANGWGLGLDYTWNKLYVTAAYQALKQLTTATNNQTAAVGTTTNPWIGAQPAAGVYASDTGVGALTTNGLNVQDNQFLAGATYDFGILRAYAQYVSRNATTTQSTNFYLKRSAEQIGVRSYITPTVEAWASAGLGRYTAFGVNSPTANFNGWQLGSNYYLSKRTNLYAIYGQTIVSNSAAGTTTVSAGASNYALGLRHTF